MSAWWAIAILFAAMVAKAETAIVVRPHTHISESKPILLMDVAEFYGLESKIVTQLGSLKLSEGIETGEHIEFSGSAISSLLRQHKIWQIAAKPAFTIPSRIIVENGGAPFNEAQLRLDLIQQWQTQCACRVELAELAMPREQTLAPGTTWRIRYPSEPARGAFNVALELKTKGGISQTLWLRGRANHYRSVPVAKRQLSIGERVQPDDFHIIDRDVTFARDAVPNENEIVGRRMRQAVSANDILFSGLLERERALRRGDQVKMSIGEQDWEVAMVGVAEQDGFIGDMVKVRNSQSQQLVTAVVTARGEVRVQ